ncbi:hypothetical protein AX17_000381 [Amanita inopinata Kibby_2008]|nr:hypothetical protein AX17_000381 [Amanita inopinata Kibby_2008]
MLDALAFIRISLFFSTFIKAVISFSVSNAMPTTAVPASHPNGGLVVFPSSPYTTATLTSENVSPVSSPRASTLGITVTSTNISPSTVQAAPTSTQSIGATTKEQVEIVNERRLRTIVGALSPSRTIEISDWLATLESNGKWPNDEVDYSTGCAARRANWPAQEHWQRLLSTTVVMAGAWHGGIQGARQFTKDQALRDSISLGMDYWFSRDFSNPACLVSGGTASCPCTNLDNTLWNTNWFSNVILIPELVGQTCLLLNETLTLSQLDNCTRITGRSYSTFDYNVNGVGFLTGANTLDVSKIGIDEALLIGNISRLTDAFSRVHTELNIRDGIKADGIRPDGSFGQHSGILYNGNYGKDYTNDLLDIEMEASGTQFAAGTISRIAFETLLDGDRWMIYRNTLTGVLHWDFSVLGRFISFPVTDDQATGSIKINLTEVELLGEQWSSSNLISFAEQLSKNTSNANAGSLIGNRLNNLEKVHRGRNYVSTLKMYSSRTRNTDANNLQPLGFHLSDGALYTYLQGNEYEDIFASWDWNLIPGITVDYGVTELHCSHVRFDGIEEFVGGVSDGSVGLAAMRYTNPSTQSLRWQKAWFFLEDDVQNVMISNISSTTNAPVLSVLDQRIHSGAIFVDSEGSRTVKGLSAKSLWHGGVGYFINDPDDTVTLSFQVGQKTGDWAAIGTSTQPPVTVDLFSAWLEHDILDAAVSYTAFPGTSLEGFLEKSYWYQSTTIRNDELISAIYDNNNLIAMAVFWDASGGSFCFTPSPFWASITIWADGNVALIYRVGSGDITVADPSQSLSAVVITLLLGPGRTPPHWGKGREKALIYELPSGRLAGSSVLKHIQ